MTYIHDYDLRDSSHTLVLRNPTVNYFKFSLTVKQVVRPVTTLKVYIITQDSILKTFPHKLELRIANITIVT